MKERIITPEKENWEQIRKVIDEYESKLTKEKITLYTKENLETKKKIVHIKSFTTFLLKNMESLTRKMDVSSDFSKLKHLQVRHESLEKEKTIYD